MKVFVNKREGGPLTRSQWKEALKWVPDEPASGRVMNLDEARRARADRGMMIGAFLLAGCWVMALLFATLGSREGAIGMFAGGIIVWLGVYLTYWLWASLGRAGLAARYRGLPDPGVLVKADEAGLTIGEQAEAWPDISLAAMHFKTDADGEYVIERLTLAHPFEGVDLDLDLIERGDAVVAYVFRRLCPEPSTKGA